MAKYEPLTRYLTNLPGQEQSLTFAEVEAIIGRQLPPSAYKHRAWWSNNPRGHVMAQAWIDAGWQSSEVDMERRKLVFRRIHTPPHRRSGFSDTPSPPLHPVSNTLTIRGLDAPTLARLKAAAELQGRSIDDVAKDILARFTDFTLEERLALADRTRAMSPGLHDIDMVAMIREDRDSR